MKKNLQVIATRLKYEMPTDDNEKTTIRPGYSEGQPDLANLSLQQQLRYSMARNRTGEFSEGSNLSKLEKTLEKEIARSLSKKTLWHKNALSQLDASTLEFTGQSVLVKRRAAQELWVHLKNELEDRFFNENMIVGSDMSGSSALTPKLAHRLATLRVRTETKRIHESISGFPLLPEEKHRVSEMLPTIFNDAIRRRLILPNDEDFLRAMELEDEKPDTGIHTIHELLSWLNEAKEARRGSNFDFKPLDQCISIIEGKEEAAKKIWDSSDTIEERRDKLAIQLRDSFKTMALGSYVEGRSGQVFNVSTKNIISWLVSLLNYGAGLQVGLDIEASRSRSNEIRMGLAGPRAYFQLAVRNATNTIPSGRVLAGGKVGKEGIASITVGAGAEGSIGYEQSSASGLNLGFPRTGQEQRGERAGRGSRGEGDPQALKLTGEMVYNLIKGPTQADIDEGIDSSLKLVMAKFPDSLAVNVWDTDEDARISSNRTISARVGASLGIGSVSAQAGVRMVGGQQIFAEKRAETGGVLEYTQENSGTTMRASGAAGVGLAATRKYDHRLPVSQGIGSIEGVGMSVDTFAKGKANRVALLIVDGTVAKNSSLLIRHETFNDFENSIREKIDKLAEQYARGRMAQDKTFNEKRVPTEEDVHRYTAETKNRLEHFLATSRRDLAVSHSFLEFYELTPEAHEKINDIYTIMKMSESKGDVELVQAATEKIQALRDSAQSWMLSYPMIIDTKDQAATVGMNIILGLMKTSGISSVNLAGYLAAF